jgi:GTP diphosphokinase / guanosine-3',5'-bis(diphosphate) 3'-diphosphatase
LVQELTDDKSLPQAERKRLQVQHAPQLSPRARLIELSDKICNLKDLTSTTPVGWPTERKREYLIWAASVVAVIRGSNSTLERLFDQTLAEKQPLFGA